MVGLLMLLAVIATLLRRVLLEPQFVKPRQGAQILGLSKAQFYRLLRKGEFGAPVRCGRARLIPTRALRAWADNRIAEAEAADSSTGSE